MDSDYYLVAGVLAGCLAVPALMSAWADGRTPRAGAVMVMIAAGLIALALTTAPVKYTFDNIPDAFARVAARILK